MYSNVMPIIVNGTPVTPTIPSTNPYFPPQYPPIGMSRQTSNRTLSADNILDSFNYKEYDWRFANDDRIVGGEPVTDFTYPWCVSIQEVGKGHFCGGSLIDPRWVLTARHCLNKSHIVKEKLRILVGGINLDDVSSFTIRGVKQIVLHSANDIALIELTEPVTNITPVSIAGANSLQPQTMISIIGWGVTSEGGKQASRQLQIVDIPLVANSTCVASSQGRYNTDREFCAGFRVGGKDACQGDSGGPAIYKRNNGATVKDQTLVGVVSRGTGCARSDKYGIYMRLPAFVDWIKTYAPNVVVKDPLLGDSTDMKDRNISFADTPEYFYYPESRVKGYVTKKHELLDTMRIRQSRDNAEETKPSVPIPDPSAPSETPPSSPQGPTTSTTPEIPLVPILPVPTIPVPTIPAPTIPEIPTIPSLPPLPPPLTAPHCNCNTDINWAWILGIMLLIILIITLFSYMFKKRI